MSDSEEFEFGDEVPTIVKSNIQQSSPYPQKGPTRKIPKKRFLPVPNLDLSEGEIESTPSSDESDYVHHEDNKSAPKDHTLKKMDSKLVFDDFEMPLSLLKKKKTISKTNTSSLGDVLKSRTSTKKKKDSSKSRDKIPIKKKVKSKKSLTPTKKTKSSTSKSSKKTPPSKMKKSLTSISTKSASSSTLVTESSEFYSKCAKGQLIKQLLCRWWYATQWPNPSSLPDKPPESYDSFDGFPGVYICTSGHNVGHILDVRDKDTCPNFTNYAQKPAQELIDLLIKAILKQKDILMELEGSGTQTEKDLTDLYKWALKLKPTKVDSDAWKVAKAYQATIK